MCIMFWVLLRLSLSALNVSASSRFKMNWQLKEETTEMIKTDRRMITIKANLSTL